MKYILTVVLCTFCLTSFSCGGGGGGETECGTEANPCLISTADELNLIGTDGTLWNKYFKLTVDIDLTGTTFNIIRSDSGTSFTGTFDGNNKKISNLTINAPGANNVGFIGTLGKDGVIKNLGLENVDIKGQSQVAGLVGTNSGTIINCYSRGSVTGTGLVGGLVGWNVNGIIENSYATGAVIGGDLEVGGLVGWNAETITNSYATASVSGTGEDVGGLVGSNGLGTIENSYATGSVSGVNYVGGLAGWNGEDSSITNSYAAGPVNGVDYAGGLVGFASGGIITSSYSRGSVSGATHQGGLLGGNSSGTIISSYWDTVTSGRATSDGGTGKTTAEMKQEATFAGWDFSTVWDITEAVTYPSLQ